MMLAQKYRDQDPTGWWLSEKLDGWRAFWDGYVLRTRTWRVIHAPDAITALLPQGIALDGELWAGRGGFLTMQSLGVANRPSDPRWAGVRYMVFDCPSTDSIPLETRMRHARKLAAGAQVGFVAQERAENAAAMWARQLLRLHVELVTVPAPRVAMKACGTRLWLVELPPHLDWAWRGQQQHNSWTVLLA
jgi:ATP-dependent DNA ligase